jgi:hypothetical protein
MINPANWLRIGVCLLGANLALVTQVKAADLSFLLGIRTWANSWSTWALDQKAYNGNSYQTVASLESNTVLAVTPIALVQWKKGFASTSYMDKVAYALSSAEPAGPLQRAIGVRSEFDVNAGYYVLPELAATVGYKQLRQEFGSTFKWSGPTVGLTAAAPMSFKGVALYGTVAYGLLTLDLPTGTADAYGHSTRPANYQIGEIGLAYEFHSLSISRYHFAMTLGYRSQTVTTKSYGLTSSPIDDPQLVSAYSRTDVRDHTQGLTLTLIGSF